ncbi:bifunctional 4-hydroxy-2-oxoglutarate aldolase/2-dehydro-3-deoxy-phosphogluconate aldolase [Arthrobacter tecti]
MTLTFDELFSTKPVMAILRGFGPDLTLELARKAWDLGIDCVEIPIQSRQDLQALRQVAEAAQGHGRVVGAGTVISVKLVEQARQAGAAFTVSPGLDLAVVEASASMGMPSLPGVATPTDIQIAAQHGLRWVKAFPASVLGVGWFRAIRGPFPQLKLVATGGIDARNARTYLDAGADVVSVGSALSDPEQLPLLAELTAGTAR